MRVLVAGGGTGGHVVPLLAVSGALKRRGAEILCVGSRRPEDRELAESAGFSFVPISAGKLRRYFSLSNLVDPFRTAAGYFQARKIIRDWKPAVIFAKGGYVSLPVVWAARRAGVPVVIHESDAVAGLANRRAAASASSIAVAFPPDTMEGLPAAKQVQTGNPLRDGVIKGKADRAFKQFKLSRRDPVVLVIGGSQGARAVNELVTGALPKLLPDAQVVHQVGERQLADVQRSVGNLSPELAARYHPRGFFGDELFDLYAAADLVIARAGANTLAELAATGKPSILIPLPSAAGDHQRKNAAVFGDRGAALVLDQVGLSSDELNGAVKRLLRNQQRMAEMGRNARKLAELDATDRLADLIWQTGSHRAA